MLDVLAGGEKEPWLDSGPSGKSHLHPQEKQPLSAVCVCVVLEVSVCMHTSALFP